MAAAVLQALNSAGVRLPVVVMTGYSSATDCRQPRPRQSACAGPLGFILSPRCPSLAEVSSRALPTEHLRHPMPKLLEQALLITQATFVPAIAAVLYLASAVSFPAECTLTGDAPTLTGTTQTGAPIVLAIDGKGGVVRIGEHGNFVIVIVEPDGRLLGQNKEGVRFEGHISQMRLTPVPR